MKQLKPAEQQTLQNWQWLHSEGYRLGYADALAGRANQTEKIEQSPAASKPISEEK